MFQLKKSIMDSLGLEGEAHYFRATIVILLMVYLLVIFAILIFGGYFRNGIGKPTEDEFIIAIGGMVSQFTPVAVLIGYWLQHKNWKDGLNDKIFIWQGKLVTGFIIVVLSLLVIYIYQIVVNADYAHVDPEVSAEPYITDCGETFGARISTFSMIQSFILSMILALGFIKIKPNESTSQDTNEVSLRNDE